MNEKNDGERRLSIGELARATGMTVRALRHYDDIGLLRASERTVSSHRRYTEDDLRRLHRVRALRELAMPLEEIGDVLGGSPEDLAGVRLLLAAHLDELTAQADRLRQLIGQISALLELLDVGSIADPDLFKTILELISMLDGYFTPDQREEMLRRRRALGPEAVKKAEARGAVLVEEVLVHVRADTPVDDPRVQDLVRRWDELRAVFLPEGEVGAQIRASTQRLWDDHNEELSQNTRWPAEELRALMAYMKRARAVGSGD